MTWEISQNSVISIYVEKRSFSKTSLLVRNGEIPQILTGIQLLSIEKLKGMPGRPLVVLTSLLMTQFTFSLLTAIIGVGYLRMMPLYVFSEAISGGETQFLQDHSYGQEWNNPFQLFTKTRPKF